MWGIPKPEEQQGTHGSQPRLISCSELNLSPHSTNPSQPAFTIQNHPISSRDNCATFTIEVLAEASRSHEAHCEPFKALLCKAIESHSNHNTTHHKQLLPNTNTMSFIPPTSAACLQQNITAANCPLLPWFARPCHHTTRSQANSLPSQAREYKK